MALSKAKQKIKEEKHKKLLKGIKELKKYCDRHSLVFEKQDVIDFFKNPKTQAKEYIVSSEGETTVSMFKTAMFFSHRVVSKKDREIYNNALSKI